MNVNVSKVSMVRIIRVAIIGVCFVCAVMVGVRVHQILLHETTSDEDYD